MQEAHGEPARLPPRRRGILAYAATYGLFLVTPAATTFWGVKALQPYARDDMALAGVSMKYTQAPANIDDSVGAAGVIAGFGLAETLRRQHNLPNIHWAGKIVCTALGGAAARFASGWTELLPKSETSSRVR